MLPLNFSKTVLASNLTVLTEIFQHKDFPTFFRQPKIYAAIAPWFPPAGHDVIAWNFRAQSLEFGNFKARTERLN